MLKKFIFIEKTSKYISISSYWVGRINLLNTQQTLIYLNPNVMSSDFGKAIKEKLNESDLISEDLFMFHFNDNEGLSLFNKNEEKKVMSVYGYKSAKAICKDALFVTVLVINNSIVIRSTHQDGLGTFGTARDRYGKAIEFTYPIDLSDEELGKAVMDAFEYSTSIYKKK
ncbi:contact-dependent growth inhibition system immunity protein [Pasteurella multocida]|uniref:contact-dependent growth inhibition system immunity protein n=1 Tax=Pasteurella multocida TaxID=747 RepID=UPI000BBD3B17|nr:contact-dependent growth inhibition system immunity protein [Pasteurella multocida]ATF75825.1 hypothetical protein CO688_10695 [Pasteurella multocida]ATN18225.1 DUF1436 domain-containing protein [Pasteurella multocida]MDC4238439.1 contact-dependent growth inhibition system immunity protein [Pasteurella multocida]WRK08107.1 contact-dependent growth inhibition system immunity protein [Pasteurella multocida]HDR0613289.1 CdiI family contact-dependent growth inhibition immunity protein [Pasteure